VRLPEMSILIRKSTDHRPVMVVENMSQRNNGEYSKYNAPQNWKNSNNWGATTLF